MKITICSSSSEAIDNKYLETAKQICNYLVTIKDIELNWGSCSAGVMGICYEIFKNANKTINGYTTNKYVGDIINLPAAKHKILDTTYDLKKEILYNADIILCLDGGIGTVSEFFSHLEEIRSNDANKLLILYNEHNTFDDILTLINKLIDNKFNKPNIYNYFKVARNLEELKNIIKESAYL